MQLSALYPDCPPQSAGQIVTGFALDHRKIVPGTIFGAFQGAKFNGEDFAAAAIAAGAIAIVARAQANIEGALHIKAQDPRATFATMASAFFAPFPQHMVAVTGTNGKTSTAELTRQIWRLCGHRAASIGTLGVTTGDDQVKTGLTTPDVITFLSSLHGLQVEGISHVAFEASSHGLSQYRTAGIPLCAAAFTNLSRDHLDYHGTMDAYFAAKMALFERDLSANGTAVIWADDAWSDRAVAVAHASNLSVLTVGRAGKDIQLLSATPSALGQKIHLRHNGAEHSIELPLIGAYQVNNVLTAAGLAIASGLSAEAVFGALPRLQGVRGRLERAALTANGAPIYVDYAHTPDGLAAALSAMRPHTKGRLILIFGAGGDRDTGKRPLMGAVAADQADFVIITDDNPRSEDPATIRTAIAAAAPDAQNIGDRRAAIETAIAMADAHDVILLAGKGHEQGQILGDRILPFDDVAVARECAAKGVRS
jgi:UDP-N-acetylmuramoyl-L-alanyl-D-glutamate--2,6-diaminopimelate ligase